MYKENFFQKDSRIKRREILKLLGKTGLVSAGSLLLENCKSPATPEPPPPPPPPPPVQVDVLVKFYNHTQGYIGDKTYTGMSDTPLEVRVSDCPDTSTVDPNLIAFRTPITNNWLGAYREFSPTGKLSLTKFPRENTEYDAFLMNNTNGADYGMFTRATYYRGLPHSRIATWDREDYYASGPDEIPHEAMRQIKESLIFPWAKYMDLTELPRNQRGDFWVGYDRKPPGYPPYVVGGFSGISASIYTEVCPTDIMKLRAFIEAIFGHLTFCYNPGEDAITYEYITDDNGINAVGKDMLAYSLVRDVALPYAP